MKKIEEDILGWFNLTEYLWFSFGERYSLRNESWASNIDPLFMPIISDNNGKVYVLPMDQDKAAPVYNIDVLEKYGVDVPNTVDDLMAACETIKTKSKKKVSCIHIGGADEWPMGNIYDLLATPLLISPDNNSRETLLDGSFDWNKWTQLPQLLLDMHKKGYLNRDVLTSRYMDSAKAFAQGKVAFGFYGGYLIDEARKINPKVRGGIMPIPSFEKGDGATFVSGERTTWGIWKDSKNKDAAKKFLAYFAQPQNTKLVAESSNLLSGISGVKVDIGYAGEYFEKYKDLRSFPYFDRVYLPNGMWDVMCKNGNALLADGIDPGQYSQDMKKQYLRLRAASAE
jgi:raffinose/stachyose/melibiose transport system substrate-binding protein